MCKVEQKTAAKVMCEVFQETEHPYNLRNDHTFIIYKAKTVQYGTETLSFMETKIWSLLSSNIEISEMLKIFKQNVRPWNPDNCPRRLYKTYIKGLGHL